MSGWMERMKALPVPDGEEPKSDVQIVHEVLKGEVKQSTFLMNVGLESSKKTSKASVVVAAHVRDLQETLERSELQAEAIREEMAAMKEKTEAAQAARDKEYEMLRKKSEEQDAKYAQLLALLGATAN